MKKILVLCWLLAGCSDAGNISGVYVRESDNQLMFVQIVKTDDGRVTGRSETVTMMDDGSIKDESFPLEGSIDGAQLSLKSNVIFGMGPSFSGTVSGNALTIVGDGGQAVLRRTTLEKFTRQKNDLSALAKTTLASNERAKSESERKAYLKLLGDDGDELEAKLPQAFPLLDQKVDAILSNLQTRHDVISGNIKKLKARWLITPSDEKGSVEGDIQAQEGDMQALAGDFDARVSDVRGFYDQLETAVTEFKNKCEKAASMAYVPLPPQCANAQNYISQYQTSRAATKAKFDAASAAMFPRDR